MTEWQVYLWLTLDSVKVLFVFFVCISTLVAFVSIVYVVNKIDYYPDEKDWKFAKRCFGIAIKSVCFAIAFLCAALLIPSTKQYAVIKVFPKIVNSDFAKEATGDAKDMYEMAKSYLNEKMKG